MYPGGSGGDGWAVGTEDAPTRRTSVIGGGVTPLTPSLRRSSGSSGSGGRNRPAGRLAEHLWKCTLTPQQEKLRRCRCGARWMSSLESLPGNDCGDFYSIFPPQNEALLNGARTCGSGAAKTQKRDREKVPEGIG